MNPCPMMSSLLVATNSQAKEKQPHSTHYATAHKNLFNFAKWEICVLVPYLALRAKYNTSVKRLQASKQIKNPIGKICFFVFSANEMIHCPPQNLCLLLDKQLDLFIF